MFLSQLSENFSMPRDARTQLNKECSSVTLPISLFLPKIGSVHPSLEK